MLIESEPPSEQRLNPNNRIIVNFSEAIAIDARVLGLLLMLLKKFKLKGGELMFTGISPWMSILFRLYGIDPSPFSGDELGILASNQGG
jgi:anti-anti-sigma regulatory factor